MRGVIMGIHAALLAPAWPPGDTIGAAGTPSYRMWVGPRSRRERNGGVVRRIRVVPPQPRAVHRIPSTPPLARAQGEDCQVVAHQKHAHAGPRERACPNALGCGRRGNAVEGSPRGRETAVERRQEGAPARTESTARRVTARRAARAAGRARRAGAVAPVMDADAVRHGAVGVLKEHAMLGF